MNEHEPLTDERARELVRQIVRQLGGGNFGEAMDELLRDRRLLRGTITVRNKQIAAAEKGWAELRRYHVEDCECDGCVALTAYRKRYPEEKT